MSSFLERQKSLFNHLKDAEEQYSFSKTNKAKTDQDQGTIDSRLYRQRKKEMKQFKGKESIFKKPQDNLKDCLRARKIPDYMKHPEKWVYYSLSDVTPDQMSDATNAATAQSFIRELEEREDANGNTNKGQDDFVFKKPNFYISSAMKKVPIKSIPEEVKIESNKVIMPEYVVGVTKKKEKKNRVARQSQHNSDDVKRNELKLQHLFEDEED